jgi:hypothetical protein
MGIVIVIVITTSPPYTPPIRTHQQHRRLSHSSGLYKLSAFFSHSFRVHNITACFDVF